MFSPSHSPQRTTFTLAAETSNLAVVRRQVADAASEHGDVADRLSLAVSELVTNVIQHTDDDEVTIQLRRNVDSWTLEVSGARPDLLREARQPPHDAATGRGLLIVRTVMDSVDVVEDSGRTFIRCVARV